MFPRENDSPIRLSEFPSTPSRSRITASDRAAATISPPESTKSPKETASVASTPRTRPSIPPYRPQTILRPRPSDRPSASSCMYRCSTLRPPGSVTSTRRSFRTSRAGIPYASSKARATTSTRTTIPAPPPKGMSSIRPFGAYSRRSKVRRATEPRSMARPTTPTRRVLSTASGNTQKTSIPLTRRPALAGSQRHNLPQGPPRLRAEK